MGSVWTEVVFSVLSMEYLEDSAKDNIKCLNKESRKNWRVWTWQHQTRNLLSEQAQRRNWGMLSWLTCLSQGFIMALNSQGLESLACATIPPRLSPSRGSATSQIQSKALAYCKNSLWLNQDPQHRLGSQEQRQVKGKEMMNVPAFNSCLPSRDRLRTAAYMQ